MENQQQGKKSKRVNPVRKPENIQELTEALKAANSQKKPATNRIIDLLASNYGFNTSDEETSTMLEILHKLPRDQYQKVRLGILLKTTQSNAKGNIGRYLTQAFHKELNTLQSPPEVNANCNAQEYYNWIVNKYTDTVGDKSTPTVFEFGLEVFTTLLFPENRDHLESGSLEIVRFIYNFSRKAAVKTNNRKAPTTDKGSLDKELGQLFLNNSSQNLSAFSMILDFVAPLEEKKAELAKEVGNISQAKSELETSYASLYKELQTTLQELSTRRKELAIAQGEIHKLSIELDSEQLRNKQKEELMQARLINDKQGTLNKIKQRIGFELSEITEVLLTMNNGIEKDMIQYRLENINNVIAKVE